MRAITVIPAQQGSVTLTEMPEPPDEDGPILVQTQAIGICGTDLEIINGDYGSAPSGQDRLIIGHESLGRVIEAAAWDRFRCRRPRRRHRPPARPCPVSGVRSGRLGYVHERPVHRAGHQGPSRLRLRALPYPP